MKLRAKQKFEFVTDLIVKRPRKNGEVFEASEERAKALLENNLVEIVDESDQVVSGVEVADKPKRGRKRKE